MGGGSIHLQWRSPAGLWWRLALVLALVPLAGCGHGTGRRFDRFVASAQQRLATLVQARQESLLPGRSGANVTQAEHPSQCDRAIFWWETTRVAGDQPEKLSADKVPDTIVCCWEAYYAFQDNRWLLQRLTLSEVRMSMGEPGHPKQHEFAAAAIPAEYSDVVAMLQTSETF